MSTPPTSSPHAGDNGKLTPEELEAFRRQLLALRDKLTGTVSSLRSDGLKPVRAEDEDEDSFDYDALLRVTGDEQNVINEIDDALTRIDEGTYGICELSGDPIGKARLQALPWARYSIKAQSEQENTRRPPIRPPKSS